MEEDLAWVDMEVASEVMEVVLVDMEVAYWEYLSSLGVILSWVEVLELWVEAWEVLEVSGVWGAILALEVTVYGEVF